MRWTDRMTMRRKEALAGVLFALPWILGFLVFTLYPIASSFYYSFTRYNMRSAPLWIGLANYETIFTTDSLFVPGVLNTLYFVAFSVPLNLAASLLIAVLLNNRTFGIRFYRTLFYLPNVVSIVAVALLWQWILDPTFGLINQALALLGVEGPGWLTDAAWSKPSLILMGLWGVGGTVVIFLASLQDVPASLYDAALIDGAGPVRKFRHITLPMISPAIFFNLVMGIIGAFQVFTQAFIMTGGGPSDSTMFYALVIYRKAFWDIQMGYASALAWILLVMILAVTLVVLKLGNRFVFYGDTQS